MKRLLSSLIGTLSLLTLAAMPVASASTSNWFLNVSKLSTYTTSHSFNVQYTVLTTESSQSGTNFCVELFQDGNATALATQNTLNPSDQNTKNGNSGTFPVTVPTDGTYSYTVQAFNTSCENTDDTQSGSTTTKVDTAAPGAPSYHGKTQSGNTYTLSFTAPSDSDVTHVQIFTSTSKTYQAGDSTRVGDVTVSPNQDKTFTYTAPDGATRYFALEAFDAAGNGSSTVGDPGTVVNPIRFVTVGGLGGGGAAGAGATAAGATTGQVQGATTTTPNTSGTGQVNAPGSSNNSNANGKVLGAETTVNHNGRTAWIASISGAVALLLLSLYYWVWPHWRKNP